MNELALFAGAGGGILGGKLLGWRTVCAVECDAYAAAVLAQRQNDGLLEAFPIWSDVRTFDGEPWRGIIDVVSGGFPCQDISVAGNGEGLNGKRSVLWVEQARVIREVQPIYAYVENSPALVIRGLGTILGDLAEMGFNAEWGVLSCADVGGVHLRERIWIKATHPSRLHRNGGQDNAKHSGSEISESRNGISESLDASNIGSKRVQRQQQKTVYRFTRFPWGEDVRSIEDLRIRSDLPQPLVCRIGHDVANGMDRLHAIGNGQVPRVAATAWRILNG